MIVKRGRIYTRRHTGQALTKASTDVFHIRVTLWLARNHQDNEDSHAAASWNTSFVAVEVFLLSLVSPAWAASGHNPLDRAWTARSWRNPCCITSKACENISQEASPC